MSTIKTSITPHLTCRNASEAIEFYQRAFGAEAISIQTMPDGKVMHAALLIDGAPFYLVEEFPEWGGMSPQALGGSPVTIHFNVGDCDAVFTQAVEAGCAVALPLDGMFWGDRYGIVVDPYGHKWSIATPKEPMDPDKVAKAFAEMADA